MKACGSLFASILHILLDPIFVCFHDLVPLGQPDRRQREIYLARLF